jgi:iron(III) transport system ATP-binding protein
LRDGVIVQSGTPAELYRHPSDAALAGFLGAVNMVTASFHDGAADTPLGRLTLRANPAVSLGSGGIVMVRPEQISVSARPKSGGLRGEVTQCRYYGHDALLYIRPAEPVGQGVLIARVPGEGALPAGTHVSVTAHGPVFPLP